MARGDKRRAMYVTGRPNSEARKLIHADVVVARTGILAWWIVVLETVGWKSGNSVSVPLVLARHQGRRYLVSMLGNDSLWVKDVRAAGGNAVIHAGCRRKVFLREVAPSDRAPIIKSYLRMAPGARPHIPVDRKAPLGEFEAIASDFPVFEICAPE